MHVRNLKSGSAVKYDFPFSAPFLEETELSPKNKALLERRVERLWLQSRSLGWSYSDFVNHLTAVLLVLRHRSRRARTRSKLGHLTR